MATPELIADPMEVKLVRHRAWDHQATIPDWIEHDQYMVFVHSIGLRKRNEACKLQVGWISIHPGAKFCPTNEYNYFTYPQRRWIDEEARRLHGNASDEHCEELPPHMEPGVGEPIED